MRFTLVLALELHIHLLLGCCFYATLVLSVEKRRETFNYHKIYDECVAEQKLYCVHLSSGVLACFFFFFAFVDFVFAPHVQRVR